MVAALGVGGLVSGERYADGHGGFLSLGMSEAPEHGALEGWMKFFKKTFLFVVASVILAVRRAGYRSVVAWGRDRLQSFI